MRRAVYLSFVLLLAAGACVAQNKWTLPKLQELSNIDSIGRGRTQLSTEELDLLQRVTHAVISRCVEDPGPGDPKTTANTFRHLRARRIALTTIGKSDLVVQGFGACMCGAVGNCPFWLIGGAPATKLLLHATGIQTFAFEKAQGSGAPEVILGSHDSAMVTELQRFRFENGTYRRAGCATLEWDDPVGNALNPPRIKPNQCW